MPNLVYKNAVSSGAANFLSDLNTLLTNPFSPTEPRGLGWQAFYTDGYDHLYFSLGSSQSERIYLRLTASNDDTYIDRQICQYALSSNGTMYNAMGGINTRITVGTSQFEWWAVANQDFIHLITFIGTTYSHYYCGLINRFAPNQTSSIYGQIAPTPSNTTISAPAFIVGANTTLFLRTGFDGYGGYGSNNQCFIPGQKLYIIDQSLGTTTVGNEGIVILNSVDLVLNTINVSYVSGANTFSSFAIIGIDPQPTALNTSAIIRGAPFLMLDDYVGDIAPQFNAVNEFSPATGLPAENIQNPDIRNVYITYPIRLYNTQEIRGTLYGSIDFPAGIPGPLDNTQTFDGLYRFIIFPDGALMLAIGSVI